MNHLPNTISIMRLLLVLPIALSLAEGAYLPGLVLFGLAGLSDGLDGYLARRYNWVSAFGKIIDPLADKMLLLVTTITMTLLGHFPPLVLFLMIAKDVAVIGGILVYSLLAGFPEMRPLLIGKSTTVLQLLLIGYLMITLVSSQPLVESWLTPLLMWAVVLVTIADGASYLWLWTMKLSRDPRWKQVSN